MSERILYIDMVGGVAGDMLLSALLDLGAPLEAIRRALDAVGLEEVKIEVKEAHPAGLRARQVDVLVRGVLGDSTVIEGGPTIRVEGTHWGRFHQEGTHHRPWRAIHERLEAAALPARAKTIAQAAFRRLAEAESKVHGVPLDEVMFHEVGADDAIADIVGVAVSVSELGIGRVVASPFPLGRGLVRGGHGPIPIPGPATLELLRGCPIAETTIESETVTPTGAALVTALAEGFGPLPTMQLLAVGVGAGHKRFSDRPNIVRALLGSAASSYRAAGTDELIVETSLDDMSPEHLEALFEALFSAGALDVWAHPAQFKKGRAGLLVSALGSEAGMSALVDAFFLHSPTLGVRARPVSRWRLERWVETVETSFGAIRIKRSKRPGAPDLIKPEHDDVRAAARAAGVPLRVVEEAALQVAWKLRDEG